MMIVQEYIIKKENKENEGEEKYVYAFLPFLHEYLAIKSKIIAVLKYGTLHG